jgi:nitrite reductase/ring-hydroxylating ferredoxin subunit
VTEPSDPSDPAVEATPPTWTPLLASEAVGPGQIVAVDVGDLELVAWRSSGGELTVCDARCPHQWSHLEGEVVVDGDELVCAAHFWRFDHGGHGSKLNERGRRDDKSDVAVFPSRERDGMIVVELPQGRV